MDCWPTTIRPDFAVSNLDADDDDDDGRCYCDYCHCYLLLWLLLTVAEFFFFPKGKCSFRRRFLKSAAPSKLDESVEQLSSSDWFLPDWWLPALLCRSIGLRWVGCCWLLMGRLEGIGCCGGCCCCCFCWKDWGAADDGDSMGSTSVLWVRLRLMDVMEMKLRVRSIIAYKRDITSFV